MKSLFFLHIVAIIFLISCNTNTPDISNKKDTLADTLSAVEFKDTTGNLAKFTAGTLPFTVDSIALTDENLPEEKLLNSDFVLSVLKNQLKEVNGNNSEYILKDFLHIDSCLKKMSEEEFNNTLDIGMMKTVKLYAGKLFELNNGNKAYTWFMKYSTLEACPYGAGTVLIYTILGKSGELISSLVVGETSGGGDAPYFSSTDLYSVIGTDNIISIKQTQVNGGDEEEGKTVVETTKNEFKYQMNPETGEIKKLTEKIGKPVKKLE